MIRSILALLALFGMATAIDAAPRRDWTAVATRTPAGTYVIGNPAARVKLVEYLSYTCPHCAAFSGESQAVLKDRMVRSGSTSVEIRPAAREALDLVAGLLARCAGPGRFSKVNDAIFAGQTLWYQRGSDYAQANAARLNMYPVLARLKALAQGSGLDTLAVAQGVPAASVQSCFATDADLNRLTATAQAAWARIDGTPTFELNGKLIEGANWTTLEPMLRSAGAK